MEKETETFQVRHNGFEYFFYFHITLIQSNWKVLLSATSPEGSNGGALRTRSNI